MNKVKYICLIVLFLIITNSSAFGNITSTFDTDLDGWGQVPGETTSISFVSTGGNPGGYIQNSDTGPTAGNIVAPDKFLGNWSVIEDFGELKWDFNMFRQGNGTPVDLRAYISGPGGDAVFFSGVYASSNTWITITAPIQESKWTMTSGNWDNLLLNVTEMRLLIENVTTISVFEITGIDNVSLTTIPAPGALLLGLFGSGIVSFCRRLKFVK